MWKKIFLGIIIITFFITSTSALSCWGIFKQNTEIQLIQKCPTCSFVNITSITYPNGTVFLNSAMEKINTNFNYTLQDSSQVGTVSYGTIGDKDGSIKEQTLCIQLTKTGQLIDTPESFFYFFILGTIFLLFITFLIIAIKTPYKNETELSRDGSLSVIKITKSKYIKLISFWISYGLFLWFITIINGIANNYIFFPELKSMINSLSLYLKTIGWGINISMIWILFYLTWKDIIFNKTILKEGKALLN